ncbi:hypothetical protein ACFX11_019824 [Malus domestica]
MGELDNSSSLLPTVSTASDGEASLTSFAREAMTRSKSPLKKKRNLLGMPDLEADVIALSSTTLLVTNRFVYEICSKGFQRDQNLQLHRRGHNLPWKLKQRTSKDFQTPIGNFIRLGTQLVVWNQSRGDTSYFGSERWFITLVSSTMKEFLKLVDALCYG